MGKDNIIILNGIRYDAKTGRLLDTEVHHNHRDTAKQIPSRLKKTPQTPLDGIIKSSSAHRRTQPSRTLMRQAVSQPVARQINATVAAAKSSMSDLKLSSPIDPKRLNRALHTKQSNLVSRFGQAINQSIKPITKPLSVRPIPAMSASGTITLSDPFPFARPKPEKMVITESESHKLPKIKRQKLSQKVAKKLHTSPQLINAGALIFAVLLGFSFLVFQNSANLSMRLAASRSGVHGSVPSYKPAGFTLNNQIGYSPGQITMSFKSNSDERAFQISQKRSDWNSETLLDNFVATNSHQFQTRQSSGKVVYLYDGSNATWVDGGVWYQIEGRSTLSSDQLLRLVDSM